VDVDVDPSKVDPVERFGSARRPEREAARRAPDGVDDRVVDALGTLSKALEAVENARGHLYAFHRLSGTADLTLQQAVTDLRAAGATGIADELDEVLVGRDLIGDAWSFQLVEDYDENYWSVFRAMERRARRMAGDVPQHLYEARMKADEQTNGASSARGHE
jgi:hypothetical protein